MSRVRNAIVLIGFIIPAYSGDITGHAIVTKRLTKKTVSPVVYDLRGTPPRQAAGESEPVNEFERMVVILEGGSAAPKAPVSVVLDQRGSRFDNDLVAIPVGSTVEFLNSDPIFHNVFSLSKAQPFDLGYYPRGQSRSVQFKHPGIVQVYCHIHANMYAAIVVTRSPWFAKPASDGSFSWEGVPPGRYRLTAWHKIAGMYATDVTVPETGHVEVSIRVPVDVEHP
jgi:plastocyanin